MKVTIINYGASNIWSVISALKYLGAESDLTNDPKRIIRADHIILPGVGSFRKGMEALRKKGLDNAIREAVNVRGVNILGICLGMQLLCSYGTEDGKTAGLGLVTNCVEKFTTQELGGLKIPHVGFNSVRISDCSGLFRDLNKKSDFYFTHSYRILADNMSGHYATCSYGIEFIAAFEINNVCGTQFHPEKSQTNGLVLLRNFLSSNEAC